MDHRTFRELAAGAALDDLDPAERAALDGHLEACPACRSESRVLVDAAAMLAYAAPPRMPPASLRGGVLAAIAASEGRPVGVPAVALAYAGAELGMPAATAVPVRGEAPAADARRAEVPDLATVRRARDRYRRLSFVSLAAAAALAIAVGGLGLTAAGLRSELATVAGERDAAVARLATTDQAMAVVLAPDHATAALTPEGMAANASVYVVYRPGTTEAWLMAGNLPAPPSGTVYQLWSADEAGVHALGTFTCSGAGSCLVPYGVDLGHATATMVTLEPAGGAVGEPGLQVAFGELES